MGRGLALQFKNAFPENFKVYAKACREGKVKPGQMLVFKTDQSNPQYIINFPTKRHWRDKSQIDDIKNGLKALTHIIKQYNIRSIAIPPLGCGLGGLNWSEVKPLIESTLVNSNTHIIIYEPKNNFIKQIDYQN